MFHLLTMLVAAQLKIAALEAAEPQIEYVEVPVTEYVYVPYAVTEYVEVPGETVYVPPEEWTVECGACGAITDWRAYTYGNDGSEVPICYDCWEYGGGWFHDKDEL